MTTDQRFERDLPDLLAEMYLGATPDYRDDVLASTSRLRQRPAWTLPERWLPMDFVDRRRFLAPNMPWRALAVLGLIALLLAALLAAYVGTRHRLPAPFGPAANGAILYAKGGDIYVRDGATGPARVLIGDPANDEAPTFSHQGDRFMFFRVIGDTDACDCDVWLANADGSGARKLAGPIHNPTSWDWSPDGRELLIDYSVASVGVMAIVPTDGGTLRVLNVGMQATGPTWRPPNGDQIAFRGGDPSGDGTMYLVKPDGTGLTRLELPKQGLAPEHDFNHGFSWSPDGLRLAYETADRLDKATVGVGDGLRIHVADIDSAGKVLATHRLEFDPKADNELQPIWLPSGDRIVFQTTESGTNYLSVAPVPTGSGSGEGTATRLGGSSTASDGIGFEIAPDGHSLLVLFWKEQTTWRYDLDTLKVNPDNDLGPLDVSSYQRLAP
jgi:Tol biopolymer transport system component